ncbi:hypothetical protein ABH915_000705 [Arthrobacter sp. MW3 TE3886]
MVRDANRDRGAGHLDAVEQRPDGRLHESVLQEVPDRGITDGGEPLAEPAGKPGVHRVHGASGAVAPATTATHSISSATPHRLTQTVVRAGLAAPKNSE